MSDEQWQKIELEGQIVEDEDGDIELIISGFPDADAAEQALKEFIKSCDRVMPLGRLH